MPSPASPQTLLALLDIELPIVQAPMAGVSSPAMAAAVANAGALGSIGVGGTNTAGRPKDDCGDPRAHEPSVQCQRLLPSAREIGSGGRGRLDRAPAS